MSLKNRINLLEKQRAQPITWDVVTLDAGIVCKVTKGDPALIGKTESELDAIYNARNDANILKVIYASQDERANV